MMALEDAGGSMCETRLLPTSVKHRKAWVDLADATVPTGTLFPLARNPYKSLLLSGRRRSRPDEICFVAPHAVQDDRQLSCHRDLGFLKADALP